MRRQPHGGLNVASKDSPTWTGGMRSESAKRRSSNESWPASKGTTSGYRRTEEPPSPPSLECPLLGGGGGPMPTNKPKPLRGSNRVMTISTALLCGRSRCASPRSRRPRSVVVKVPCQCEPLIDGSEARHAYTTSMRFSSWRTLATPTKPFEFGVFKGLEGPAWAGANLRRGGREALPGTSPPEKTESSPPPFAFHKSWTCGTRVASLFRVTLKLVVAGGRGGGGDSESFTTISWHVRQEASHRTTQQKTLPSWPRRAAN